MIINPNEIIRESNSQANDITAAPRLFSPFRQNANSSDIPGFYEHFHYTKCLMFQSYSTEFIGAISSAVMRVRIIDPYFLDYEDDGSFYKEPFQFYSTLFEACPFNIQVITNGTKSAKTQLSKLHSHFDELRKQKKLSVNFSFEVKFFNKMTPSFHDRFALVDEELWHFGANVGGTHNDINCFSRGWLASKTNFEPLFSECWRMATS
ncbi:MAG: hypothetical protein ABJO57_14935 [Lentilitoribacter sp.]